MLKRFMNRRELLARLAGETRVEESAVGTLLEALVRVAGDEAKTNNGFVLPGIGLIQRRESSERRGKNPQTGETIRIPAKVNLTMEFTSRFRRSVLSSLPEREGMLTTRIWQVPLSVLETLQSSGGDAEAWNTLDPKGFEIDPDFTALLDEYADLFAYVLKREGEFPNVEHMGGLAAGYVTPQTVKDRASELQGVRLDELEEQQLLAPGTSKQFSENFRRLQELLRSTEAAERGLVIITYF